MKYRKATKNDLRKGVELHNPRGGYSFKLRNKIRRGVWDAIGAGGSTEIYESEVTEFKEWYIAED